MEKIEEYIQQFTAKDYLIKLGIQGFEKLVQILITLVALLIVKFIALKLLDFYYTRYEKYAHKKPNATLRSLLENAIRYVYYFFLIYSVLSILGVPVATLVAGAGVLSLAVGFGAQGFVSDIVNGFSILFEGTYQVGDFIHVGNYSGNVVHIGLRTTILEDWDHYYYYLPHRNIAEVINESVKPIRYNLDFIVYPDTNFSHFEKVVKEAVENSDPEILDMQTQDMIYYGATRDSHDRFIYRLRFHTTPYYSADVEGYYYVHISQALTDAGIERPLAYGDRIDSEDSFEDVINKQGNPH